MLYCLGDLLFASERQWKSKIAVVDGIHRITYGELLQMAQRSAASISEKGVCKGDRVAIFLRRSIDAVAALLGTYLIGGVAVMINEVLKTRQVNHILQHSEASVLVTDSRLLSSIRDCPIDQNKIIISDDAKEQSHTCVPNSVISADLAMIMYTSGSTGLPKGIMLTHGSLLSGAYTVSDYLDLSQEDTIISLLPFSFDYGLNQLLTSMLVGGTLVIQRSLFPADICNAIVRENVTGIAGVPLLWCQLAQKYSPFMKTRFPGLRYITNSGGRFPENVVRLIRKSHPEVRIFLMYGLTEAFRSTYLPPDQVDVRPTSIGKAIPNVEILVINDEGKLCEAGEVGELVHRGANISMGYWKDPESTAKVLRPCPLLENGDGRRELAVYSGDLVKRDEEGYLYFIGRKDQLMKSRGVRVSPDEIEECVSSSNLVSSVVVFGVTRDGEPEPEIVAAVVPKDLATFREEDLVQFCHREMPEYLKPQRIWRLNELPETSNRKPDRAKVKESYVEMHGRSRALF
jgi:acyl-CoA ligase (AMP-forming) (exosortase A-associated)